MVPAAIAKRILVATSLVTCMENSQLTASSFNVTFNPDDRSLHYSLTMATQIDGNITAEVEVYAYGFRIITQNVDLCEVGWKQFCPLNPGNVQVDSIQYVPQHYANQIPGIAYQVPDIDAYARVRVYNNQSENLACVQAFFSNGKTVSQTGVKWATAVVAGIGLLLSALLSTFGNSTAASHISANTMSLFLYFQSVVVVSMEHVHRVPPIAEAWAENLAWSMGLIRISFMQRIFRWYIESTGGNPSLYLTSRTVSLLTQRSLEYLDYFGLVKRATNVLYGNSNVVIFRGIERLGYSSNIENTSIVATGFTFFILCGYVLAGFIMACKYSIELSIRCGWMRNDRFLTFRQNWKTVLKGSLLRYIYIGFTQMLILSFWEFTKRDSPAVIVIACFFIVLSLGLMLWAAYRTWYFATQSIQMHNNPAAYLYGDEVVLNKYGFFYTMFNARRYWWNIAILSYIFVKAVFIAFAQASGKTQSLVVFIIDLVYFIALIYYKPYLDKPTNIMSIFISTVTLVNSFLFMFFSDLFNQSYTVSAVMGWIFFIMNAAFSLILLLMVLTFIGIIIFSKNPDSKFRPIRDDRTSFQRYNANDGTVNPKVANELMALGDVANDHDENWESHLYDQQMSAKVLDEEKSSMNNENSSSSTDKPTLSEKILRKFSLNRTKSKVERDSNDESNDITRLTPDSDQLSNSPPKKYPGVTHIRQASDSQNGLINSYEQEESFKLNQPDIMEDGKELPPKSISRMPERDISLDSMTNDQDPTQKTDILGSKFI